MDPVRHDAEAPAVTPRQHSRLQAPGQQYRAATPECVSSLGHRLLVLQRLAGNRAVAGILREWETARAEEATGGLPVGVPTAERIEAERRGGVPLAADIRQGIETAVGSDVGHARIHEGPAADQLARSVGAQAFATGPDVFFRAGAYRPGTLQGDSLLAHELRHVTSVGGLRGEDIVHRQHEPGGPEPLSDESAQAQQELEDFRNRSYAPLENYHPSSGLGQFNAAFDVAVPQLTITLKIGFTFVQGDPSLVSPGFRPEEFQWQPGEQDTWKAQYLRDISSVWTNRFAIHSTKPHWETMNVPVNVQIVEDASNPHFRVTISKMPPDARMVVSSVCPPGTHHSGAYCPANPSAADSSGTVQLDSNDLRREAKLDWGDRATNINFGPGSNTLEGPAAGAVQRILDQMTRDPDTHVTLVGHADTRHHEGLSPEEGAIENMDLARGRTMEVAAVLIAGGIHNDRILQQNVGEEGAGEAARFRRVDALVSSRDTQLPGAHETGHMLGLADEYVPQGGAPGAPVEASYGSMVTNQTGDVLTTGTTSSVMSSGTRIERWHYSTFLEALKRITSRPEWGI